MQPDIGNEPGGKNRAADLKGFSYTSDFWAFNNSRGEQNDIRPFSYSEPHLTRMLVRAYSEGIEGMGIDGMLNKRKIVTYFLMSVILHEKSSARLEVSNGCQ